MGNCVNRDDEPNSQKESRSNMIQTYLRPRKPNQENNMFTRQPEDEATGRCDSDPFEVEWKIPTQDASRTKPILYPSISIENKVNNVASSQVAKKLLVEKHIEHFTKLPLEVLPSIDSEPFHQVQPKVEHLVAKKLLVENHIEHFTKLPLEVLSSIDSESFHQLQPGLRIPSMTLILDSCPEPEICVPLSTPSPDKLNVFSPKVHYLRPSPKALHPLLQHRNDQGQLTFDDEIRLSNNSKELAAFMKQGLDKK